MPVEENAGYGIDGLCAIHVLEYKNDLLLACDLKYIVDLPDK
jgi:hypothetical protein